MKIYNPITKIAENLNIKDNTVSIYTCGPTVYDDLHIGNMRPVIVFDTLARFLSYTGVKINFISNITDIDDKIINRAIAENVSEVEIAKKYTQAYKDLLEKFNIKFPSANQLVNATSKLNEMYEYIQMLIDKKVAYKKNGSVYFSVSQAKCYGKISGQNIKELQASEKADKLDDKEEALDFALWKKTTEGVQYQSPFGPGRPGWHTECSCINFYSFTDTIDIHGGGVDLKFPHHENENAQYFALTDKMLANFWMYVGFITLKDKKMSKSTGNLIKAKSLLEDYDPNAYRLLLLAHSYLQPINFSFELMEQYQKEIIKIKSALERKKLEFLLNDCQTRETDKTYLNRAIENLNDNFNTPLVVSQIFELVKELNKETDLMKSAVLHNTICEILENIMGFKLNLNQYTKDDIALYREWNNYKLQKDFIKADEVREKLIKQGVINETKRN